MRTQGWVMLRLVGINVVSAVGFYTLFVYSVTSLEQTVHVGAAQALDLNTLSMGVLLLTLPLAGALSDRVGRKPLLLGSALGMLSAIAWTREHQKPGGQAASGSFAGCVAIFM